MSIAAIKAGKAFYEILAEDKTAKGLGSAEARLRKFGTTVGLMGASMASFAAAGLTAIGAMVKSFAGAGDEISDAMNVTGLSGDFLQTLRFNAADAGVELNALVGGLTKFNNTLAKAAAKGGKIAGLDAAELMKMNPDERIKAVVDAIEKIPDPAMRAKAAMEAFGKSGAKLLPAFEGGAAALNEAMADLKSRGLIMSDEDRQLAVQAEGAFLSMGLAIERVTQVIAAAATPAFLAVFDVIQTVIEGIVQFIDQNRGLVAGITIGLGVLAVLGGVLMAVGAAAIFASFASAGFAAIMTGLGIAAAVLASPITLIVAAITACGIAALVSAYYLDQLFNGGAALQYLKDMATGAMTAMQMLWTAISNGRWDLAGQLIMDGLNVAFTGGILALKTMWSDFTGWLYETIVGAMQGASDKVLGTAEGVLRVMSGLAAMRGQGGVSRDLLGQADMLGGARIGMGAGAASAKELREMARQAALADDQKAASDAAAALGKTMAEIAALPQQKLADLLTGKGESMADLGNVTDQMRQSSRIAQSAGFASSIGAGRIGFAAPANQAEEKQVELLGQINKGVEILGDKIEDLEGLAFE